MGPGWRLTVLRRRAGGDFAATPTSCSVSCTAAHHQCTPRLTRPKGCALRGQSTGIGRGLDRYEGLHASGRGHQGGWQATRARRETHRAGRRSRSRYLATEFCRIDLRVFCTMREVSRCPGSYVHKGGSRKIAPTTGGMAVDPKGGSTVTRPGVWAASARALFWAWRGLIACIMPATRIVYGIMYSY